MKRLSEFVPRAIGQKEILRAARAQAAFRHWEDAVGTVLAEKTVPDRFEKGVLWVCAQSAVWAQELRMNEDTVLERLNDLAAEQALFREMRVVLRPRLRDLNPPTGA